VTTLTSHETPTRRDRPRIATLACVLTVALASALALAPAAPASGTSVVTDCADDSRLDKRYTPADYKDALQNIPTDVDEYTDCRDVIRRAQLAQAGGGGDGGSSTGSGDGGGSSGGGAGGASPGAGSGATAGLDAFQTLLDGASPQERAAVQGAIGSPADVRIGGRALRPDAMGDGDLGTLNALPAPFLVVLLLLAIGTVAATLPALRSVVRTRRQPTA